MTQANDLLVSMDKLLDQEKCIIGNGDYEALMEISNQKMALIKQLRGASINPEDTLIVRDVLQKSSENGLMVEAALRFWLGAHKKLIHLQSRDVGNTIQRQKPYAPYRRS